MHKSVLTVHGMESSAHSQMLDFAVLPRLYNVF